MVNALPLFDVLTPFMLEGGAVRGRVVRLGAVADTILGRYDYPPHVARMLGELLLAAAMLSSNLKQQGIFTLQVRGNGLVPLMVVDAMYGGALRGYAEVKPEAQDALRAIADYNPRHMVGEGAYMAITLDPGENMERYQGIVALEGDSIAEALMAYFTNSEQLAASVQMTVEHHAGWNAAGLMIERLPSAPDDANAQNMWDYARAVGHTVTSAELLDPRLDAPALLYRLFHEEGVWVYDPHFFSVGCRCSRERIVSLLSGMKEEDRKHMVVDGRIDVHCQFCNKSEILLPKDVGL